ncbi:hypothetical protein IWQ60_008626 [Tieghemiomyces parasiticus]|uniref:Galactose oxidase n=1 Tax=Tieghemiomyces parasiticus TaxID=78921 RepID=A0A9W8DMN0_9FUNG|nr:hypothetical protein IWQ60_008626 [Tieghemiomyces parasiticus]
MGSPLGFFGPTRALYLFVLLLSALITIRHTAARYGHTTSFVPPYLLIQGGNVTLNNGQSVYADEDFRVDLRYGLDAQHPGPNVTNGPPTADLLFGAVAVTTGDYNDPMVYLIGGDAPGIDASSIATHMYNVTSQKYSLFVADGAPPARCQHTAVWSPATRRIFVYGGEDPDNMTHSPMNDLCALSLDMRKWDCFHRSIRGDWPPALRGASGSMINTTHMLLFGGITYSGPVSTSLVYVLNTVDLMWQTVNPGGDDPPPLVGAAALVLDNSVVFYGNPFGKVEPFTRLYSLYLGNGARTSDFEWFELTLPAPHPVKATYSAVLVGRFLVSTFGYMDQNPEPVRTYDLDNMNRVTAVDWNNLQDVPPAGFLGFRPRDDGLDGGPIVGIAGGVAIIILGTLLGFVLYPIYRRNYNSMPFMRQFDVFRSGKPQPVRTDSRQEM